jgi:Flp pilus assembly protein CpaB
VEEAVPAFPVPLSVRARRAIVRPAVRRTAVAALAVVTAVAVASLVDAAGAARDRWGATRPVAVATRDLGPGDVVDAGVVEVRELPRGVVGEATLPEAPVGAVVRHPILAGEPVAPVRLAPDGLTGVAALVPAGERAVAIPLGPAGVPPLAVGDLVDVVTVVPGGATSSADGASGDGSSDPAFTLVERAAVVDVAEEAVTIAVPDRDAPRVAWAVANGAVVLALAGA